MVEKLHRGICTIFFIGFATQSRALSVEPSIQDVSSNGTIPLAGDERMDGGENWGAFQVTQDGVCSVDEKCGSGLTCVRKCRSECVMAFDKSNPEDECIKLGGIGCKEGEKDNCCRGSYCVNYGPKSKPLKKCNKCSVEGESCEHNSCCNSRICTETDHICV